jgi:hypothetical protein
MEKKDNLIKKLWPVIFLTGILLTSCEDFLNNKHDNYDNSVVALGFVKTNTADQTFMVNLDNGSILSPEKNTISSFGVRDSERVWVRFNPDNYSQITDSTKNYHSRLYELSEILYKNVKKSTEVSADSAGHDPIIVRDAWISPKNILNVDFRFYSSGSVHYINLLSTGEGNGIDKPIVLELHHNARGDAASYLVSGLVSFNLNSIKVSGKNSAQFVIRYTDYRGNQIDMPRTFTY